MIHSISLKKALLISLFVIGQLTIYAFDSDTLTEDITADTTYWSVKGLGLLSVNQHAFVNWAAGGESALSGKGAVEYDATYTKDRFSFEQAGNMALGLTGYMNKHMEKTDDKLELLMTFNHLTTKYWSLTALASLKTQFADGYKYPDDSTLISTFFAPAYLTVSFGFTYKADDKFQLFLSPISGKMTFVKNSKLANEGAFGVKKALVDTAGHVLVPGKQFHGEVGLSLMTSYKALIMENVKLNTALNLHNNYMDLDVSNRWNIDVDLDTRVIFAVNKLFSTIFYMQLKYDHNALIPNYEVVEGEKILVSASPKLQFKESFGLGVTYQLD